MASTALPFTYRAQQFRGPIPGKRHRGRDMAHMGEVGSDTIKLSVVLAAIPLYWWFYGCDSGRGPVFEDGHSEHYGGTAAANGRKLFAIELTPVG
jgi:hypothetical protein